MCQTQKVDTKEKNNNWKIETMQQQHQSSATHRLESIALILVFSANKTIQYFQSNNAHKKQKNPKTKPYLPLNSVSETYPFGHLPFFHIFS